MQARFFLISLLVSATAVVRCADTTSRQPASGMRVVPLIGIGNVRFGTSQQEVVKILGEPDKRKQRTLIYCSRGFDVLVNPGQGVWRFGCYTKKAIPWWDRPFTKDFQGATEERIGMGSGEKRIVKAFGKPDERNDQGRQVQLSYEDLGFDFLLLSDKLIQFWMRIPSKPIDTSKRRPIYEEKPNGEELIKEAVSVAGAENKRILIVFGYNHCFWCWKLHDFLHQNEKVWKFLEQNYVVVRIDITKNKDLAKRLKEPGRYPGLVFLGRNGQWVASEPTGPLVAVQYSKATGRVTGTGYVEERVLSVLNKWSR